jgi:hypothetical protein
MVPGIICDTTLLQLISSARWTEIDPSTSQTVNPIVHHHRCRQGR